MAEMKTAYSLLESSMATPDSQEADFDRADEPDHSLQLSKLAEMKTRLFEHFNLLLKWDDPQEVAKATEQYKFFQISEPMTI